MDGWGADTSLRVACPLTSPAGHGNPHARAAAIGQARPGAAHANCLTPAGHWKDNQ